MGDQDREKITKILIEELKKLGVRRIAIFGSFARNEKNPNDIDVLVLFEPGAKKKLGLNWFTLADTLSKRVGFPVDLVTEESLPASLEKYVQEDLKVIYEKAG